MSIEACKMEYCGHLGGKKELGRSNEKEEWKLRVVRNIMEKP